MLHIHVHAHVHVYAHATCAIVHVYIHSQIFSGTCTCMNCACPRGTLMYGIINFTANDSGLQIIYEIIIISSGCIVHTGTGLTFRLILQLILTF